LFKRYYDVEAGGNWEGKTILNVAEAPETLAAEAGLTAEEFEAQMAAARAKLYRVRAERIWPGLDDKVLTSWNGLMLAALAEAGRYLGREDYTAAAVANAEFLYERMRGDDGRLSRTWKAGHEAKLNGYLEDYAYLAEGVLALYQTTFEPRWFAWAQELVELMIAHFGDEAGGFFDTADDHEQLLYRPKELQDNATPSGNSVAAGVLLQMSLLTGNGDYWERAAQMINGLYGPLLQYPRGFGNWLSAAQLMVNEPQELALVGDNVAGFVAVVRAAWRPWLVVAAGDGEDDGGVPLLGERPLVDGEAAAYLCQRFVCQRPVTTVEGLVDLLG
ncbi:MAG TPA: thioredoxin domain-containing protein, partial [Anaerolineae bacterium]|nr:thioredoxin domain-containing protein [Anaerolineae bacterium]